ncbi:hypothetical protein HK101_009548 [Irineochytrium annulatum]|nr:hypothetical protein HK101_009548 [Irineochytrium annulatum]
MIASAAAILAVAVAAFPRAARADCYHSGSEPGGFAFSSGNMAVSDCTSRCGVGMYAFITGKPQLSVVFWNHDINCYCLPSISFSQGDGCNLRCPNGDACGNDNHFTAETSKLFF